MSQKQSKNIKTGISVKVIAGQFRGTVGKVIKIKGDKVAVDNVPKQKKCRKADPRKEIEAGFDMIDRYIDCSNVQVISEGDNNE